MMDAFVRVGEWFVKLDLPDPRVEWPRMLAESLVVALIGIVLIGLLLVTP